MKALKALGLLGILALASNYARADKNNSLYLLINQTSLNPSEYNAKIKQASTGDVFNSVSTAGIGYEKSFSSKISGGLEVSANSQIKDAVKEDLSGNQIKYGSNSLSTYNIDPQILYKIGLGEKTLLEAGIGPAITIASVSSKNETDERNSNVSAIGAKFSVSLKRAIKNYFIKLNASYRTGKNDILDVSGSNAGVSAGVEF
jgi:hypothetical protein